MANSETNPTSQTVDFLASGGWSIIHAGSGGSGLVAHRGVLHPAEYVDPDALARLVAEHLGFTLDDLGRAYRPGRPPANTLALRARIDARLLEVAEAGGNMVQLGLALGWGVSGGACQTIGRALVRARRARTAREAEATTPTTPTAPAGDS